MAVPSLPAFDPRSVDALRRAARGSDSAGAIRGAAQQFEALMLQQMIKAMRATVPENTLFDSSARKMWQELSDQQLANDLAKSGGVGLARMLTRQWLPQSGDAANGVPNRVEPQTAKGVEQPAANNTEQQLANGAEAVAAPVSERSFVAERTWWRDLLGLDPELRPVAESETSTPLVRNDEQQEPLPPSLFADLSARAQTLIDQEAMRTSAPANASPITFQPPSEGAAVPERIASFVRQLLPAAEEAAAALGVPAQFLLAQAALETGWGASILKHPDGRSTNNLFNIKAGAGWAGERVRVRTTEYLNGRPQQQWAEFRSYPSAQEAFADYVRLVQESGRYQSVQGARTPEAFARALAAGGYATDPHYAQKLVRLIKSVPFQSAVAEISGMKFA